MIRKENWNPRLAAEGSHGRVSRRRDLPRSRTEPGVRELKNQSHDGSRWTRMFIVSASYSYFFLISPKTCLMGGDAAGDVPRCRRPGGPPLKAGVPRSASLFPTRGPSAVPNVLSAAFVGLVNRCI